MMSGKIRNAHPTIMDVAREAGVSVGTVSHVLTGSQAVSVSRRSRVMEAMVQLDYVPNIMAQGLRQRYSRVIGLCVPHHAFSYFATLSAEIEALASAAGYEIMHVFSHQNGDAELRRIQTLLKYKIGGLLLLPSATPQNTLDVLAEAAMPTVVLDRPIDDRRFDQVIVDTRAVMRKAAAHLVALGHERLVFVTGNQKLLISRRRIEGLRLGLRGAGGRYPLRIVERGKSEGEVSCQIRALLSGPDAPTAIVSTNTIGTGWIFRAIRAAGLRCPDEVLLLAADEPSWAEMMEPTLSVVHAPATNVAREAWRLLLLRIQGDVSRPQRIALEPELRFSRSNFSPKF